MNKIIAPFPCSTIRIIFIRKWNGSINELELVLHCKWSS